MFALKVGDAFQSKISALQRSDGISTPYGPSKSILIIASCIIAESSTPHPSDPRASIPNV
jgi:hypothetical protein